MNWGPALAEKDAEIAELKNQLRVGDLGAANHLAAIEAENDRLRAALEKIVNDMRCIGVPQKIARAALGGKS